MKAFLKTYWMTILFFALIGLLGGFFTGIYLLDSYPEDIKQQLINELSSMGLGSLSPDLMLGAITAIQSAAYGLVLGGLGIWLAKRTGLWKDEINLTKKPLIIAAVVSVVGGLAMLLPDLLFFGQYSDAILNSFNTKPTIPYLLATVTYGAVIEEVMLRLFFMSLIAFVINKFFAKGNDKPTEAILILANIITALIFAAGHLPSTFIIIGDSPIIIFRCFLLNGGLGLAFGYLYRKYGLRYAMLAHGGCHIVSKVIWILFI